MNLKAPLISQLSLGDLSACVHAQVEESTRQLKADVKNAEYLASETVAFDLDGRGGQNPESPTKSTISTRSTEFYSEPSANAALTLLAVACALLDRQVARLAVDFETEGGFTERLYRVPSENRRKQRR